MLNPSQFRDWLNEPASNQSALAISGDPQRTRGEKILGRAKGAVAGAVAVGALAAGGYGLAQGLEHDQHVMNTPTQACPSGREIKTVLPVTYGCK